MASQARVLRSIAAAFAALMVSSMTVGAAVGPAQPLVQKVA